MEWVLFEVVSRDARPHPEERACRKGPADWYACTRVSKDEDGTDLGFTRDRQNSVPKSATADLGALMLRDASRRTWAVEAPALASGRNAPQHEGEGGGRRILAKRSQAGSMPVWFERTTNLRLYKMTAGAVSLFPDCYLQ